MPQEQRPGRQVSPPGQLLVMQSWLQEPQERPPELLQAQQWRPREQWPGRQWRPPVHQQGELQEPLQVRQVRPLGKRQGPLQGRPREQRRGTRQQLVRRLVMVTAATLQRTTHKAW